MVVRRLLQYLSGLPLFDNAGLHSFGGIRCESPGGGVAMGEDAGLLRVLLAEDSPDNALLIQTFLRDLPLSIEQVWDGHEAVSRFMDAAGPGRRPFDLVLMDVQMPYLDGYDATRAIRNVEARLALRRVPVLILTAFGEEDRNHGVEAGADAFLVKPLQKSRVLGVVRELLGLADGERHEGGA